MKIDDSWFRSRLLLYMLRKVCQELTQAESTSQLSHEGPLPTWATVTLASIDHWPAATCWKLTHNSADALQIERESWCKMREGL